MPCYDFRCKECNLEKNVKIRMSAISEHKEVCVECNSEMTQVIKSFSASVKMDRQQVGEKIKEDARKIAEKVRSGDQKIISEIYGEK